MPARYQEACGLYVVEALAAGVPVVLPGEGAFPEIVETTHGGLLYDPLINGGLSESLDKMLSDPLKARKWACGGVNPSFAITPMKNLLNPWLIGS